MTEVIAICAVATNGVIGRNNKLPWCMRDDLVNFRNLTTGNAIVMGRNTYESLAAPLPNRTNLVLTTQSELLLDGFLPVATPLAAFRHVRADQKLFVIGGPSVWEAYRPYYAAAWLTRVHGAPNGDTHFYVPDEWYKWPFRRSCQIKANDRNDFDADIWYIDRLGHQGTGDRPW